MYIHTWRTSVCINFFSLDPNGISLINALHTHIYIYIIMRSRRAYAAMETITEADLIPPHKRSLHDYKQLWHHGSIKTRIWALYKNDKAEYIAAYRPKVKPDFFSEQEYGMKVFQTCERRIMNQHWDSAGQAALLKSIDMLKTRPTTLLSSKDCVLDSDLTDLPVLISIDVEGNNWDRRQGMRELGIATLDLRESCQGKYCRPIIYSTNYILNSSASRRKFLFNSSSQRIAGSDTAKVRDVISSNLFIPDPLTKGATYRRVILIGHGVATETRSLEELGLPLDAFPTVVGIVDTCTFATRVTKQHLSLEQLIDVVGIPLHRHVDFGGAVHLHCAGNDANYTLRALLALLEIEARSSGSALGLEALGRIAREDIPKAAPGLDERSESSSDEGLTGTFFDEHCDFKCTYVYDLRRHCAELIVELVTSNSILLNIDLHIELDLSGIC
jgi:hypothetical protein